MKKFLYIYYAGKGSGGGTNEEWMAWFGKLGDKLVDGGNPLADGAKAVTSDGEMAVKDMPATGYSIVHADSMAKAVEMAKDSPLLKDKHSAVAVYEALPM